VFTIKLNLPSGKTTRLEELNNRDYLCILKFCQNGDLEGLNGFFEKLYFTSDLNIFDRFYILLSVRKMFVDSKLTFVGKDEVDISYGIDTILSKLTDNYVETQETLVEAGIEVDVGIPCGLFFEGVDELYQSTIMSIRFNDTCIDFLELSIEEKNKILDRLPTAVFLSLQSYIKRLSDTLFDITLIEENKQFEISEVKINIIGNGVLQFLSSIFAYDLVFFYEAFYYYNHFVTKGSGDFFDMSFNETRLLLKLHSERIDKENKEIKRQQRLI
jgi:hypothetical protein